MSFSSDIRKFAEKSMLDADKVIRSSGLELTTGIVKRTPVKSGRARGNWFASIGAPSTAKEAPTDATGAETIAAASVIIEDAPGNILYITNNLPYMFRLEYEGWSTQAPAGMVRVTVTEFEQALTKAINEL